MKNSTIHSGLVQELSLSERINIQGGHPIVWFLSGYCANIFFDIVSNPSEACEYFKEAYKNA